MYRLKLPACTRCSLITLNILPQELLYPSPLPYVSRRHRTGGHTKPKSKYRSKPNGSPSWEQVLAFDNAAPPPAWGSNPNKEPSRWSQRRDVRSSRVSGSAPASGSGTSFPVYAYQVQFKNQKAATNPIEFFKIDSLRWTPMPRTHKLIKSFGISATDTATLLREFSSAIRAGELTTPEAVVLYDLQRVGKVEAHMAGTELGVIYTNVFYQWASRLENKERLVKITSLSVVDGIRRLVSAADRSHPTEEYPLARKLNRKVIMHVGPTNSGKTYHALRALAASNVGVYAGPLRLLAHEIWERLNLGEIAPLGAEAKPIVSYEQQKKQQQLGEGEKDAVPEGISTLNKRGNPEWARKCNMLTGEESKVVDSSAPLLSCTVEMLASSKTYDVAVVDEIQMIADEQRGGAWTSAVLGLCAQELHLCGEETAVPIIKALLRDTGDEIIVNRYERLTPLTVEEKSLDSDLSRIQPGDCVVTFSRTSIFGLKRNIEAKTGMKCAVVYGKLPPEIRSEQAALFNEPNSGYDVIIGSDAIGMGLNLKIRRVVFEAVQKWNGVAENYLSISQTKQIAGRAGRYGLHTEPGGYTTTLHDKDLFFLRTTLDKPVPPLTHARIGINVHTATQIAGALPPGSSLATIHNAHIYTSRLNPAYKYGGLAAEGMASGRGNAADGIEKLCDLIDQKGGTLPLKDRMQLMNAPVSWRNDDTLKVVSDFMLQYNTKVYVSLMSSLEKMSMLGKLGMIEDKMRWKATLAQKGATTSSVASKLKGLASRKMLDVTQAPVLPGDLLELEVLHKILVTYMWMSFRNPVAYSDHDKVVQLKAKVEVVLDWALGEIGAATVAWRREGVARIESDIGGNLGSKQEGNTDGTKGISPSSETPPPSEVKEEEELEREELLKLLEEVKNARGEPLPEMFTKRAPLVPHSSKRWATMPVAMAGGTEGLVQLGDIPVYLE